MSNQYLLVRHDGAKFPLGEQGITIGRHSTNNIVISEPAVSRNHARILVATDKLWVRDENSAGGTFVNEQKVQGQQVLQPGDILRIGNINFRLDIIQVPKSVSPERKSISKVAEATSISDLFISYSRNDMPFVRQLHAALTTAGKDVWVDWQDIPPSAEWKEELQVAIRETNTFVFVISPDSANSSVCREEISYALSNNKRIVPLVRRDTPREQLPSEIGKFNWIFIRDQDDFHTAIQTLITALDTDLAYLRTHTRLQIRATEWESQHRSNSLTLRGEDLSNAEAFLTSGVNTEPYPTALQVEYITTSRQIQTRNQRRVLIGVSTALFLTIILAVLAFWQFQLATSREKARATQQAIAEEERQIALSNGLSAQARLLYDDQLDLALLLGVLASQINPGGESRSTLHDALEYRSNLKQFINNKLEPESSIIYSSDGKQLITAGEDGEIRFWDLDNGKPVGESVQFPGNLIYDLVAGREGQIWTLGLDQEMLIVWDAIDNELTGTPIKFTEDTYPEPDVDILVQAALSPDGKKMAVSYLEFVTFYDVPSGRIISESGRQHEYPISVIAFSPDGEILATAGNEWKIYIWDALKGEHITIWDTEHTRNITSLAFSSDGQFLASGSEDGTVNVFNRSKGKLLKQQPMGSVTTGQTIHSPASGHPSAVRSLAFTADGEWLISGAEDGNLLIWNTTYNLHTTDLPRSTYTGPVHAIASHPFESEFAINGSEGLISIWQPSEIWRLGPSAANMTNLVNSLDFISNNQISSINQFTYTGGIFDLPARVEILDPAGEIIALADCEDQTLSVDQPCSVGKLQLLNSHTSESVSNPYRGLTGWPELAVFSPDQGWLAVISCPDNGTEFCKASNVHLWDTKTETLMFQENIPAGISRITFSPDNRFFAMGGYGQLIYLLDLELNQITPLSTTRLPADLKGLAFSPDGSMIAAAASFDDPGPYANTIQHSSISLWDLPSKKIVSQIDIPGTTIHWLEYSTDSRYIRISHDGDASIWHIDLDYWQQIACRIANRNLTEEEWNRFVIGETYREVCPDTE